MKYVYIYILMFLFKFNKAQVNLVPNDSFEDTIQCFAFMPVSNPATTNHYLKNWCTYKNQSPDYYNTCANSIAGNSYPNGASVPLNCYGYQSPHNGSGYVGIALYWLNHLPDSSNIDLELLVVKLKQPLIANNCYYGEFYLSSANINAIVINHLGMLLSSSTNTTNLFSFDNIIQPQIQWDTTQFFNDTLNWIKVSGNFIAQGGEEFLTIGNFRDGAHVKKQFITNNFVSPCGFVGTDRGCYVYIDDVSLYEIPNPNLGADKTMCLQDDSISIGDNSLFGSGFTWYRNDTLLSDTTKTITVKPNYTSTYILHNQGCTADTIVVNVKKECVTELIIPNTFTPNADDVNDTFKIELGEVTNIDFKLYNRWGNLIYETSNKTILWDGRTTSGESCTQGVYFYTLKYTDVNAEQQTRNGYVSLFR